MKKYIFVTGGVCSSLGKGLASASLGTLLENRGFSVCMIKIDPYINVDAGTMSPYQHGEVYVTDDGAETDLDLGNYARFTHSPLSAAHSITTGQIYDAVIRKEREGKFLGKCVQVVPHITDEIKRRILSLGEKPEIEITIVEIGGTVGDIESIPYLEAVRQIIHEKGHGVALSVHLTLVPTVTGGEVKTKPTQHSVKEMREIGIQPDVLLCRCQEELPADLKRKISQFTNIDHDCVLSAHDVDTTIYEIPVVYHHQGMDEVVCRKLGLRSRKSKITNTWGRLADIHKNSKTTVNIAMVGKYIELADAYKSVDEALVHGAFANEVRLKLTKVDSEDIEQKIAAGETLDEFFAPYDGILIPGGFGSRGILGMVQTARFAREKKIPCFGICLGLQIMVIEYSRSILGLKDADSSEFRPEGNNSVISLLEEQVDVTAYGGTMRLGLSESHVNEGTHMFKAYGSTTIHERHRHRYEVSNSYREALSEAGLILSGTTPDGSLVESVEWPDHPWGVGVQFHPEFTSSPIKAGPLFKDFILHSLKNSGKK
ncbi:CTP synthase [Oceanispirochaeta crateris]|jgi:CTP synthase|uniref:CTP synthase n=1 Tax=Oceanispirochaeta crateris TaxID=2518645 RepID=A0A5C1QPJ5_9SPIO|nr:CTP synthase [Oceanispirochaeta crateris]QEN08514.1 CTP synthase [Oceanispirochaeta crateris]